MGSLIFDDDPIGSLIFDVLNGKPASASRAPHHIVELWMLSDETGDEGAFGDHFEPLPADDLERALRQARADAFAGKRGRHLRSEEHTSELQSLRHLVCRLLLE